MNKSTWINKSGMSQTFASKGDDPRYTGYENDIGEPKLWHTV